MRKQQQSRVARFAAFCSLIGEPALPASDRTVAAFVAALFDEGYAKSSIDAHITAVRQLHDADNVPFPDTFYLRGVLAGVARSAPPAGLYQRAPLLLGDLARLVARPASDGVEEALCRMVMLVLWWACRRVSLLCSTTTAGERAALRWCDIQVSGARGARTVTYSQRIDKTHQNSVPFSSSFIELPASAAHLCPVRALERWAALWRRATGAPAAQSAIIARWPSGAALTRAYFNEHLRARCARAGIDANRVSSHSLRRGAATTADSLGVAIDDIMDMGGWRSSAVGAYVASAAGTRRAVSSLASAATAVGVEHPGGRESESD